jgi:hypothetical protein
MDLGNVPELRKAADGQPGDLRTLLAADLVAAMQRKGMGAGYYFEISGCLIPNAATRQIDGGWIIILARKTGLLGEQSIVCAPGTIPTGFPSADQLGMTLDLLKKNLDELHRSLMPGLNGRGGSGTAGT